MTLDSRHDWHRSAEPDLSTTVAHVPLFADLGRRKLRMIVRNAELADFVPGDLVVDDDAPTGSFYVILRGEAELRDQATTRRLRPGDYFGESALADGPSRPATVIATDELHVLRLPRSTFARLAERSPTIAFAVLKQLGRQVERESRQAIRRAA